MVLPEVNASGGIIQVEVCSRVSSMLTWPLSEPAHRSSCQETMTQRTRTVTGPENDHVAVDASENDNIPHRMLAHSVSTRIR